MNEDRELMAFAKGRLEEGLAETPPFLAEIERAAAAEAFARAAERRSRRRLWSASLLAASLAAMVGGWLFSARDARPAAGAANRDRTIAYTIDLLRASDGDTGEFDADAVAEMLLAWQDAPYESAIAGISADSAN